MYIQTHSRSKYLRALGMRALSWETLMGFAKTWEVWRMSPVAG